jgi:hypothetical protein
MLRLKLYAVVALVVAAAFAARGALAANLNVQVDSLVNGGSVAPQYTFCVPAATGHVTRGPDKNPRISWSAGPAGTQSYAVIVTDTDGPSVRSDMNQEGKTVAADLPRLTSYHWVLVDIPANVTEIPEGADADGAVPHGKPQTPAKFGVRGVNVFTNVFAANPQMNGNYFGYDGPCPPWNDGLAHRYHFRVYALNVPSLNLSGPFDGNAAISAMFGHILAVGEVNGSYSLNPAVK